MLHAVRQPVPPLSLGEGPVWHARRKTLYFVDIEDRLVYGYREGEGIVARIAAPDRVGFAVPWGDRLLAGVGTTLCQVNPDEGTLLPVRTLDLPAGLRFNDGKCDPEGRLWAGVMAVDRSRGDTAALGALYGIDGEGVFQTIAPMDIPNGMAWDAEGRFYHTDTSTGRIDSYRRRPDGTIEARRPAITVPEGVPDGFCMDAEGMLWVALWGGGKVQRFNPRTGLALAEIVVLPERSVSCCCFGGEAFQTLYITTAKGDDGNGGLYACQTQTRGLPSFGWRGLERMRGA